MPDVVLIGRQDVIGPLLPRFLEKKGKIARCASPQGIVVQHCNPPIGGRGRAQIRGVESLLPSSRASKVQSENVWPRMLANNSGRKASPW